ncbi:MAG TPA: nicotinate-nucleotide adenylyltransferase [Solirubrobacteraceae bacterium]|jgi:nicotinate-nucleotide adenylyltransferase|nr:nicotinate-nucleotide adenylyltransferase [Solirubrobacteraceae bacterium]
MARLGILGGTFDPPHIGHLVCAQEARAELALDRVLLMPVAVAPHKARPGQADPEHRLAMCELAAAPDRGLEVSAVELERGGMSFTVDTLRQVHARQPEDHLSFIVGGDAAASFASWREPEAILELAELAVAERVGAEGPDLRAALAGLPADRVHFFDMPRLDVSSTTIRERVAAGRPVAHLAPGPVLDYIERHRLYRPAPAAGEVAA